MGNKGKMWLLIFFDFLLAVVGIIFIGLTVGELANIVPDGILGLIVMLGFIIGVGAVIIFAVLFLGGKVIKLEYEENIRQIRTSMPSDYYISQAESIPESIFCNMEQDEYERYIKTFSNKKITLETVVFRKRIDNGKYKAATLSTFVFVNIPEKIAVSMDEVTELIGEGLTADKEFINGKIILSISICFLTENFKKDVVDFCLSNYYDREAVHIPVACEIQTKKLSFLFAKNKMSKDFLKHIDTIEKLFQLRSSYKSDFTE